MVLLLVMVLLVVFFFQARSVHMSVCVLILLYMQYMTYISAVYLALYVYWLYI